MNINHHNQFIGSKSQNNVVANEIWFKLTDVYFIVQEMELILHFISNMG